MISESLRARIAVFLFFPSSPMELFVMAILPCLNAVYYIFDVLIICLFFKNLFMAVLGLRFCARAFSSCGKWGPLFIAVRKPLIIAASLVADHRLQTRRLSNCGSRA